MSNFVLGTLLTVVGIVAVVRGAKLLSKVTNRIFDFFEGFLE